jgi:hypothetical protein
MRPILCSLSALVVPTAWALAAGPASAGTDVIATPDIRIHLERAAPWPGAPQLIRFELQGEVTEAAARDYGFRSMRSQVEVDCRARRGRVRRLLAFAGPGLSGPAAEKTVPADWAQPSPGAYLAEVIRRACPGAAPATKAFPMKRAEPEPPRGDEARPAPALGAWLVQIAASPDAGGAQRALGRLPAASLAGHAAGLEAAEVHGRRVVRAVVRGFRTRAAADAFCSALPPAAKACWPRPDRPGRPSLLRLAAQSSASSSTRPTTPP